MDFRKNFSERLCALRKSRNVSMASLGEQLSVTDEAVRLLEKGKRSPSFEVLCALADYFDVSIDYLVGRSASPVILDRIGDAPDDEADSQSER